MSRIMDANTTAGRHPATVQLARYFDAERSTLDVELAAELEHTAAVMIRHLPDSAELTVGLRKLLEARDCFSRAATEPSGQ